MIISIIPPYFSIGIFAFFPISAPVIYPVRANMNEIIPIITIGKIISPIVLYPTQVKVTPIAIASILVAIDSDKINNKLLEWNDLFASLSEFLIIFHPT